MKNFIFILIAFAIVLTAGCSSVQIAPEGVDTDLLIWCEDDTYNVSSNPDGEITTSCEVNNPFYNSNKGRQCICHEKDNFCTCTK